MAFDITEQIACVKRELAMREQLYPRWVQAEKMSTTKALDEIHCMRDVLATLQRIEAEHRPELPL